MCIERLSERFFASSFIFFNERDLSRCFVSFVENERLGIALVLRKSEIKRTHHGRR